MCTLAAMVFLVSLAYGASLPLAQLYLGEYLPDTSSQALAWHVGMLGGVYTFGLFLFAPWWGRVSDARGRAPVLRWGFATFLAGTLAAALAPSLPAVYLARLLAGAGAAAIMPGAQAFIADVSDAEARSRRFVVLGSAAFTGFLAGPAFGTWAAGPMMGMAIGSMPSMVNWAAIVVVLAGVPVVLALPWALAGWPLAAEQAALRRSPVPKRRFVAASMALAFFASFATGTFEIGFSLFGGQTLGLPGRTMAVMFITCSVAMLGAQALLLLPGVRQRLGAGSLTAAFIVSALILAFTSFVPDAASLALLVAAVATSVGMIGPVLSYELLESDRTSAGSVLGRQAAAGNLGQALGSMLAGAVFALHALAPFWSAALALVLGAVATLRWWGPARRGVRAGRQHGGELRAARHAGNGTTS